MNAAQQELFDLAILRVLDANRSRFGLNAEGIGHMLIGFGFGSAKPDDVVDRVDVLARKGLVEEVLKALGAANRAWRITTKGIAIVDERG